MMYIEKLFWDIVIHEEAKIKSDKTTFKKWDSSDKNESAEYETIWNKLFY